MTTKFESLPYELIMTVIEYIDNPHLMFLNLNSNINRILFDHRIKLSVKIEDHRQIIPLQINLTRLVVMHFKGENLQKIQNLKSLTLFIDENIVDTLELPSSLIYFKIYFNADMSPSLFQLLPTLKQLETLILSNKKQSEVIFPLDSTVISRNIKILQLKNIPVSISSIYHCEALTELKYLELQLTEPSTSFHYTSFAFPSRLKTLIIQFQLSFTDLEYVLQGCAGGNLKRLELYSHTNTSQPDYFSIKRWCILFERFQNLTKCKIDLRQRSRRGVFNNTCLQFAQQLETVNELKTKWNMKFYRSCPGYHGCLVYVNIVANL